MISISRLWLSLAAMGAGTIHLAVGASAPLPLAILLVGFGIAELGWAVATLLSGRLVVRRLALFGALVPVFVWGATAPLGSGFGLPAGVAVLPPFPMMVASLFGLFMAVTLAVGRRIAGRGIRLAAGPGAVASRVGRADAAAAPQGWRFLSALTIGAAVFSGLTTPALAATEAGAQAAPHGSHGLLPGSPAPTPVPSGIGHH